jgi:antitoxin (DNA-binding transcriptional repressor) of toxin-antitoxin stability system
MSIRVGVRELREKLSEYMESMVSIEVTRHGQTVGFYIPVPKTRGSRSEMHSCWLVSECRKSAYAWEFRKMSWS